MPNVLAAVRSILAADAGVSALAGDRIYPGQFPQDVTRPAVVIWSVSSEAYDCLDGGIGLESPRMRIECVSMSRADSDSLWLACNKALSVGFTQGTYAGTFVRSIAQSGGHFHLEDRPYDGTDRWVYRTVQTFEISYHIYER